MPAWCLPHQHATPAKLLLHTGSSGQGIDPCNLLVGRRRWVWEPDCEIGSRSRCKTYYLA